MWTLPPLPAFDAVHPLIVHFPIALLLVAPLLIVAAAVMKPEKARPYLVAALALMFLGTAAIYIAVESGEAAGKLAERTPQITATLERHENLAERTQVLFTVLTAAFGAVVIVPVVMKKGNTRLATTALPVAVLALYTVGVLSLVNTAHNGGRLVHEFGVHAMVGPGDAAPAPATAEHEGHGE